MGNESANVPPSGDSGNGRSIPKSYRGAFERVVDKSGRVLMLNDWRAVGESKFLIVVWPLVRSPEFLQVLPPGPAAKLYSQLGEIPLGNESANVMLRAVTARSYETELDDYGRLPIPEEAAKAVGISGRVMLVGGILRFELWNPDRYRAFMSRSEVIEQVEKSVVAWNI